LHISCTLVDSFIKSSPPEVDLSSQDWLGKIITTQAALVDSLFADSKEKHREISAHALERLWLRHPKTLPGIYKNKVISMSGVSGVGLLSVLVRYYSVHQKGEYDAVVKKEVMEVYVKEVSYVMHYLDYRPGWWLLNHDDFS